ncbi:hypothetical protein CB1_000175027 [Camelus ferus]|nr:hypothetical protein CB1_000175027 [Camelus ferus]
MGRNKKKKRDGDDRRPRLVLSFDEEKRREYLTGFHKRKVERKKAAIEEIKQRLKEEQKKLREERHQEYLKMLAEREEALEEADELDWLVTAKTESVQYDHPNHTVTVTTISDLDLSGARLLGLPPPEQGAGRGSEEEASSVEKPTRALPRKSRDPLLSQRISSLTASLHAHSRKKVKRKHPRRAQDSTKKPPSATRTSKTQRRRLTGKARHSGESHHFGLQELPSDSDDMEGMAGNAPCGHFEANVLTQSCCQNCFHPEEAHRAVYQEPRSPPSAEAPYCDLPRRPPTIDDLFGASTSSCQSVVGPGLGPGPERGPSAGLPAEGLTAAPRSQEPEAVPYLPSSLCGSFNESSDSGTSSSPDCDAPDDTSNSSSVVRWGREARAPVVGAEVLDSTGQSSGEKADPPTSESESPHHDPPYVPPAVCIGHRDAPRASSPPRHTQFDPFPFLPDTSDAENQSPQHDPPQFPPPVCIGYRDAPRASSPPRQAPEPSLLFQDLPRASTESLAPSTDSLHEHPHIPTPVCIGHRDAPSFSSPPRQAPEPSLFFQDLPGTSMESLAPSIDSLRGSPMLPPQVCIGHRDAPRASSPPRHPPSDLVLLATSPPPGSSGGSRGSVPPGEARHNLEREEYTVLADLPPPRRLAQREPGPQGSNGGRTRSPGRAEVERLFGQERRGQPEAWEEHPQNGLREPPGRPAQRGWGSLQELSSPHQPMSPSENSRAGPVEFSKSQRPETPPAVGWWAEGVCPHLHGPERRPELDWRELVGLLGAPREGAWTHTEEPTLASRLPRLDWEGLLELLQAQLPCKDPAGHWGGPATASPGTKGTLELEQERHNQPEGAAGATLLNGYSPGQWPQSSAQPPSPASVSTQWPKTKVTGGPETSTMADLEKGQLGNKSPADGPSSPLGEPDLLNFKKGWMSILDEPGEWKKHWFVLTDSSLKYYRDSTAEEADELDGEIDLRSCTDVTEYAVQRNYGFQIHTKDAVYTLSAMTSGIRRNWIEALRKTVRPTSAPDVTKLSDCNKENTLHSYGTPKGSLKAGEQRGGGPRKADGQRQSLDYVELSPLTQSSPQRARTPARTLDRPAKQEELERDLAQRSEERRKWFEATDSRATETPAGEGPRRGLGAPLTEDQQSRLSEEIEKKWQELEKLPLRENKRVPLTALLNQGCGERRGPPSDSHEVLEKEVQSLRAQLEVWRLQGEAPQGPPKSQEDGHIPPGYISQEACERSLAEMESSHQQVMEELQRHHERELQRLQQEKEWLLAEETAATASAIEAMKKAYQEELSRELSKTRSLQQGPDGLRKQHQSDMEALKRELQVLSEQYSQKCLEIGALTRQAEEREHTLRRCQQEGQELLRHNQELHARLSEEIDRLRGFIASQGSSSGCGRSSERSSCELEVLLRVKENELQYLKKEVQCLRDELQMMQKDKRFTSGKYQDVYVELNHIKTRSEREIEQLKEHLRLAMAALQEKEAVRNSLAE